MIFFIFTLSTKSDFKNFEKALIILLNYMTYTLDKLNVYKYFFYFQKLPFQIKKNSFKQHWYHMFNEERLIGN